MKLLRFVFACVTCSALLLFVYTTSSVERTMSNKVSPCLRCGLHIHAPHSLSCTHVAHFHASFCPNSLNLCFCGVGLLLTNASCFGKTPYLSFIFCNLSLLAIEFWGTDFLRDFKGLVCCRLSWFSRSLLLCTTRPLPPSVAQAVCAWLPRALGLAAPRLVSLMFL